MPNPTRSHIQRGFHIHAICYVLTNILLVAINLAHGAPYWVLWPIFGWGLGILAHWWFAIGPGARTTGS